MLERAERILMDEMPIIPIYFYVSRNLVRPYVRGLYNNLQDMHPLQHDLDRPHGRRERAAARTNTRGSCHDDCSSCGGLLAMVVTLWIVFTVSFLLMRSVPGGPYSGERNLPPEIEENIKHRYQLDLPLYEQYLIELQERRAAATWA